MELEIGFQKAGIIGLGAVILILTVVLVGPAGGGGGFV